MNVVTIAVLLVVFSVAIIVRGQEAPVVTTKYGKLKGVYIDSVAVFYGVPFASPPVGSLRWKKPEEPKPWGSEVYNATATKPACPQYHCQSHNPPLVCPKETSEDCLYLDIFTPRKASPNGTGYPVMIFIHGGNFYLMAGSSPLYDGRTLSGKGGVILVNINYRLGALGFLVTGESDDDARGNYGILDQQQSLKWVSDNIKDFGGDPSKITVFGQSAGAQSTLIHMTLPSSSQYFHQAIIESTPIAIPYKSFSEAILLGGLFAELLGCQPREMSCLRSKTSKEIAIATSQARTKVSSLRLLEFFEPWGPFVDGNLIKGEPLKVLQSGQFSPKPLLIGSTSEETVLYIYSAWNTSVDDLKYAAVLLATYPAHVLEIIIMYPPSSPSDEREQMVKMSTDLVFTCPTRNATRIMRSFGLKNVWTYVWDHAFSFPGWGPVTFCEGRVCHGSELVFLFHSAWEGNFTFSAAEEALSAQIMEFWTNFAKTGNPNDAGMPGLPGPKVTWPVYDKDGNWPFLRFQTPQSTVENEYRGFYCDFWDTIGYAA